MNDKYDIIIVGSGLGGLACGVTLSKEGYHVCVVEKNAVAGGCFQSFRRGGRLLDTGIHYIGSMDEGEILRQYFTYFGIQDRLVMRRMDEEAFDVVNYKDIEYHFAMGHERFVDTLSSRFPAEHESIQSYLSMLGTIGNTISVEQLRKGMLSTGALEYFSTPAWGTIASLIKDDTLRQVLSSPALLYGGEKATSTFYHHAMITDSYLKGAYRFIDGSMQVVDALTDAIRRNGGTVRTRSEVTGLHIKDDQITAVEINNGELLFADHIISTLHPAVTMRLVEKTPLIRKAHLSRLDALPNSYGLFSAYLLQKKNSTDYYNRNLFIYGHEDVWHNTSVPEDTCVRSALLTMQPSSLNPGKTDVICLMTPMHMKQELMAWENTSIGKRGESYEAFKREKAEELIAFVARYYPEMMKHTEEIYTTTPLSYRDYTATPEGSAYGIMKNYKQPLATIIPHRTRIANLLLAGQNLNVHGALGVTLTSMLTCATLLGMEYLAKRIGDA